MMTASVRGVLPLALGFLFLAVCLLSAVWLSLRQDEAGLWVRHTLEVENRLNLVQRLVTDAETGQRGYLLTGRDEYLRPYRTATTELPSQLDGLLAATADNGSQQRSLQRLRGLVQRKLNELGGSVELARIGRGADAIAVMRSNAGERYMSGIREILTQMAQEEERLLASRTTAARRLTLIARSVLLLSALLIVGIAIFAVRDAGRRLRTLEERNRTLGAEVQARSQAQGQVHQLQKMEAVGQLTGGIAHDFNNMLAIVIGSLDMARRKLSGAEHPTVARNIDNAQEGAERAATLTARLLAFARRQPLEPRITDANRLVGGMSELLRRTLGERVQVETILAGGLWRVNVDPAQLESSLVNLAVNARDAMPDGGMLTIETANAELDEAYARQHDEVAAGHYVMLSVTDTGMGMTSEIIERAFEPFYTTKEVGRGTGLGLSQLFGFVKQSHGHVKIYSEVGAGTTIKLYLPRHHGEAIAPHDQARDGALPAGRADEIILVVEDEQGVRRMTVDALRELGYTVVEAADGNQALEQLALQPRVDLLFTDIVMPGMTGRQLADRAHESRPDLKILYTTGYTRNAIVHQGVVDYDVAYLPKPFSVASLARKVREVLGRE